MSVTRIQQQEDHLETVVLTAEPHTSERKENTRTSKILIMKYCISNFFLNFIYVWYWQSHSEVFVDKMKKTEDSLGRMRWLGNLKLVEQP